MKTACRLSAEYQDACIERFGLLKFPAGLATTCGGHPPRFEELRREAIDEQEQTARKVSKARIDELKRDLERTLASVSNGLLVQAEEIKATEIDRAYVSKVLGPRRFEHPGGNLLAPASGSRAAENDANAECHGFPSGGVVTSTLGEEELM